MQGSPSRVDIYVQVIGVFGFRAAADPLISDEVALSLGTRGTELLPAQTAAVDEEEARQLRRDNGWNVRE